MMSKIIADACANHCGKRELMARMVEEAAKAGVDVIKFQSWRAKKLRKNWPDYEKTYEYYKEHQLSKKDHEFLIGKCLENKIEFLTTVFDLEAVNFLAELGLDRIKIASSDCNSWRLIDRCLSKFSHVIISTGMHSPEEVEKLKDFVGSAIDRVTVMHCVSLYPAPPEKTNLLRIGALMSMFPSVGYSDHTMGTDAAKLAMSLGVSCVEKHFTLDRTLPGKDQALSATIGEFGELAEWRKTVQTLMYCPDVMPDAGTRGYIGKWGDNS